jgi:hypothetical protein
MNENTEQGSSNNTDLHHERLNTMTIGSIVNLITPNCSWCNAKARNMVKCDCGKVCCSERCLKAHKKDCVPVMVVKDDKPRATRQPIPAKPMSAETKKILWIVGGSVVGFLMVMWIFGAIMLAMKSNEPTKENPALKEAVNLKKDKEPPQGNGKQAEGDGSVRPTGAVAGQGNQQGKEVEVKGYTNKNGTVVAPYTRSGKH